MGLFKKKITNSPFAVEKSRKIFSDEKGWYMVWREEDLWKYIDDAAILDMNDPDEEFYPGEVYQKLEFPEPPIVWETK